MKVFNHHIYEYKKGLRCLVLHTLPTYYREQAERRLIENKIPFLIRAVTEKKINIFFGEKECVKIVESFGNKPLNHLTSEEDFILGTMLGYCRLLQCRRYLKRKNYLSDRRIQKELDMATVVIVYGSSTGNTQQVAEKIQSALGSAGNADLMSVDMNALSQLRDYDVILLGTSTWGFGDLQDDWDNISGNLGKLNLQGKKVGFFGTGDQESYNETFVDAMGILYEYLAGTKADFIGSWPIDGYTFSQSKAVKDGMFVGLALDEDNQANLSDDRISDWVKQILKEI